MMGAMEEQIRNYITDNLMFGEVTLQLDDDASLLELGIVDSVGVMELVLFVEEAFSLQIADDEIVLENFDSITQLSKFVQSKLNTTD